MIKRGQIQLRGMVQWRRNRLALRLKHGSSEMDHMPVVFGNAIPKNGSKLLYNILRGFTRLGPFVDSGLNPIKPYFNNEPTDPRWIKKQLQMLRPGDIRFGYLYATEENMASLSKSNWANFIIIRDPRDAIISEVFYALDLHPGHLLHEYLESLGSMEARIDALIEGIPEGDLARVNVWDHYERFLLWIESPFVNVVRFENLINDRRAAITGILNDVERFGFSPDIPAEEAISVLELGMAPGKSDTFRKGKTGEWRNYFTDENMRHFKAVAGDLLVRLEYEEDDEW